MDTYLERGKRKLKQISNGMSVEITDVEADALRERILKLEIFVENYTNHYRTGKPSSNKLMDDATELLPE